MLSIDLSLPILGNSVIRSQTPIIPMPPFISEFLIVENLDLNRIGLGRHISVHRKIAIGHRAISASSRYR